ncbi:MAG: EF-hand domain-containing protein [Deltaproteobacteria bacterium]|nr:EF-hand domain-containing protein [Deltaproteobacteria bacterium]
MKRILIVLAAGIFLCGCTTFGTFSNLEKGKSSKDEILSMLGEPSAKSYEDDKEAWKYHFIKKDQEKSGNIRTVLNLDITFKDKEVENYYITISKESVEKGEIKIIQEKKLLPPARGHRQPRGKADGNFIGRFDTNNDGRVSMKEFPGPDQVFKRFDRDNDGYIDKDEAPQGPPPSGRRGVR